MNDRLERAIVLIQALRNSRDAERNWRALRDLIEGDAAEIVAGFPLRWLVSVCDTYADNAESPQSENALLISMFVNMARLAETRRFVAPVVDEARLAETRSAVVPLFDGVTTFAVDLQDTYLNLAKRAERQLANDRLFLAIWREVVRRMKSADTVIAEFADWSAMPERYLPEEPAALADNYGTTRLPSLRR